MSKENYQLIDGVFEAKDAMEIVGHMFDEKIKFHQYEIITQYESCGSDGTHSKKRIMELKAEKAKALSQLSLLDLTNKNVKLHCMIEMVQVEEEAMIKKGSEAYKSN